MRPAKLAPWLLLLITGCSAATEPEPSPPSVTIRTTLQDAYLGEELPPPTVTTDQGKILVGLSEWFLDAGYTLKVISLSYRPTPPPPYQMTPGFLSLNIESRAGMGIGLVWRQDSEVTIAPLPAGQYYLRIMRYDPDILPSLHPFGNPRLPVDTIVTVP